MSHAPKPPVSSSERARRDHAIWQARLEETSWKEIAARFGVSQRQAQRAAKDAARTAREAVTALDHIEPLTVLREIIDGQRTAFASAVALTTAADSDNGKVGACRAVGTVGESLRDTLVAAGLLPFRQEPGPGAALALESEARTVALRLARAAERAGLDADTILAAVDAGGSALPARTG
ncbi:MAG TPA: hypothetical protein VFI09_00880 [Solirubrobacterales bacterium]|nr:hypothetical protein [Solirubrobacterales bacterium]